MKLGTKEQYLKAIAYFTYNPKTIEFDVELLESLAFMLGKRENCDIPMGTIEELECIAECVCNLEVESLLEELEPEQVEDIFEMPFSSIEAMVEQNEEEIHEDQYLEEPINFLFDLSKLQASRKCETLEQFYAIPSFYHDEMKNLFEKYQKEFINHIVANEDFLLDSLELRNALYNEQLIKEISQPELVVYLLYFAFSSAYNDIYYSDERIFDPSLLILNQNAVNSEGRAMIAKSMQFLALLLNCFGLLENELGRDITIIDEGFERYEQFSSQDYADYHFMPTFSFNEYEEAEIFGNLRNNFYKHKDRVYEYVPYELLDILINNQSGMIINKIAACCLNYLNSETLIELSNVQEDYLPNFILDIKQINTLLKSREEFFSVLKHELTELLLCDKWLEDVSDSLYVASASFQLLCSINKVLKLHNLEKESTPIYFQMIKLLYKDVEFIESTKGIILLFEDLKVISYLHYSNQSFLELHCQDVEEPTLLLDCRIDLYSLFDCEIFDDLNLDTEILTRCQLFNLPPKSFDRDYSIDELCNYVLFNHELIRSFKSADEITQYENFEDIFDFQKFFNTVVLRIIIFKLNFALEENIEQNELQYHYFALLNKCNLELKYQPVCEFIKSSGENILIEEISFDKLNFLTVKECYTTLLSNLAKLEVYSLFIFLEYCVSVGGVTKEVLVNELSHSLIGKHFQDIVLEFENTNIVNSELTQNINFFQIMENAEENVETFLSTQMLFAMVFKQIEYSDVLIEDNYINSTITLQTLIELLEDDQIISIYEAARCLPTLLIIKEYEINNWSPDMSIIEQWRNSDRVSIFELSYSNSQRCQPDLQSQNIEEEEKVGLLDCAFKSALIMYFRQLDLRDINSVEIRTKLAAEIMRFVFTLFFSNLENEEYKKIIKACINSLSIDISHVEGEQDIYEAENGNNVNLYIQFFFILPVDQELKYLIEGGAAEEYIVNEKKINKAVDEELSVYLSILENKNLKQKLFVNDKQTIFQSIIADMFTNMVTNTELFFNIELFEYASFLPSGDLQEFDKTDAKIEEFEQEYNEIEARNAKNEQEKEKELESDQEKQDNSNLELEESTQPEDFSNMQEIPELAEIIDGLDDKRFKDNSNKSVSENLSDDSRLNIYTEGQNEGAEHKNVDGDVSENKLEGGLEHNEVDNEDDEEERLSEEEGKEQHLDMNFLSKTPENIFLNTAKTKRHANGEEIQISYNEAKHLELFKLANEPLVVTNDSDFSKPPKKEPKEKVAKQESEKNHEKVSVNILVEQKQAKLYELQNVPLLENEFDSLTDYLSPPGIEMDEIEQMSVFRGKLTFLSEQQVLPGKIEVHEQQIIKFLNSNIHNREYLPLNSYDLVMISEKFKLNTIVLSQVVENIEYFEQLFNIFPELQLLLLDEFIPELARFDTYKIRFSTRYIKEISEQLQETDLLQTIPLDLLFMFREYPKLNKLLFILEGLEYNTIDDFAVNVYTIRHAQRLTNNLGEYGDIVELPCTHRLHFSEISQDLVINSPIECVCPECYETVVFRVFKNLYQGQVEALDEYLLQPEKDMYLLFQQRSKNNEQELAYVVNSDKPRFDEFYFLAE